MKRIVLGAVAATVLAATPAWAVAKGGSLYIKCASAKLLKDPKATGAKVADLAEGEEVVWNGAAAKPYHDVSAKKSNKSGFVDAACLSPSKPATEYATTGGSGISSTAFASSGAATKGLSEGAIKYADGKGADRPKVAAQLVYVEENTKHRASMSDSGTEAWAKKAGVNVSGGKEAKR
jgi:hypothetical protein